MTGTPYHKKSQKQSLVYGGLSAFLFFILLLLLRNTELAASQIRNGLTLCGHVIIPSLFPFLVLSELMLLCGIDQSAAKLLHRPMGKLFKLSGSAGCALILGGLCGYPVGARMGASLYDRGEIDRDTLSFLLMFCNNASPAFLIGTVGTLLWGERWIGFLLFLIQLLSSALIGICFARKRTVPTIVKTGMDRHTIGLSAFPLAFVRAVNAMLSVCAYVIFFSAVIGVLDALPWRGDFASLIKTILFGLFEISSGMKSAASLSDPALGFVLSALFMGWSGLSVHGQIITATADRGVSYRRYFFAKALQGLLCAGMATVVCLFFFDRFPAPCTTAILPYETIPPAGVYLSTAFFLSALFVGFLWKYKMKKYGKFE